MKHKGFALIVCLAFIMPVLAILCAAPSCTTTQGTGTSQYVRIFTIAKTAEDVLKTARLWQNQGKITDEQFAKVKAAYDALREAEQLVIDGKGSTTLVADRAAELSAVAAAINIAYGGDNE